MSPTRKTTPSYVLTLPLQVRHHEGHILEKRFETARKIYNACLAEAHKRLRVMQESKAYQKARKLPKNTPSERHERATLFRELNKRFKFQEFALHTYVQPMQKQYKHLIDSHVAQKLATLAFDAVQKLQWGEAKKVHYKRFGEMRSVEGKNNAAGLRFKDAKVCWLGLELPILVRSNDVYAHRALDSI